MVVAETDTGAPAASDSEATAFLRETAARVRAAGYAIGNVSVQVVGTRPRLGPRRDEAGRRQQGVAGRMGGDIAVGVTLQPVVLVRPRQPRQVHRYAGHEAVHVDADPHAGDGRDVTTA